MFSKILVANRGEIALRVIRACKELGIQTVAVYSEADANSPHVRFADEAICIGPPVPSQSYLDIPSIISAAEIADVDAIHPGYGFLSENAHFAEICESCNITFIGPRPESMRMMGNKMEAREMMRKAGIPVSPGSTAPIKSKEDALKTAKKIGYPVIIKASAGGGGRGMRVCHNDIRLISALTTAQAEAEAAFGNGEVFIEKYIEKRRHVEFQVLADQHGHVLHLGERDCSIQRRHQKLVEETPSTILDARLRRRMADAAVKAAKIANYVNAGTIEFLVDESKNFYFMEMNTRLQVEHPVTEMATGIDLVKEQIYVAAGHRLRFRQDDIKPRGAAIEVRINAEDPDNGFQPCPGTIEEFYAPGGPNIRLDSHIYSGYQVPPNYDSMLAKLIAYGPTRQEAIRTMRRALDEFVVEPLKTTISFHRRLMNDSQFIKGKFFDDLAMHVLGEHE